MPALYTRPVYQRQQLVKSITITITNQFIPKPLRVADKLKNNIANNRNPSKWVGPNLLKYYLIIKKAKSFVKLIL